jgi:DNA gyrase subunit A
VVSAPDDAVVVTIAGASDALPGTQAGTAKVSPFAVFPAKGRATGGVRAQRFLRGEDTLLQAWVGAAPARASGSAGQAIELPEPDQRRDGSGVPLPAPVHTIG